MDELNQVLPLPQGLRPLNRAQQLFSERARNGTLCRKKRYNGTNATLKDALFNDTDPWRISLTEKPRHRKIIQLAEQGCSTREIAAVMEMSAGYVSNVLRQPWARERMINEIREDTKAELKAVLEAEVFPSLRVITEIRDNPEAKSSDRLAAAFHLLDRNLGKPNQPFSDTTKKVDPSTLNDTELLEQLAASGITREGDAPQTESAEQLPGVG